MYTFTIGSDVEFFVCSTKGNIVPAINYLPGTKEDPYPLQYGHVQVDNVAAELNVIPSNNPEIFNSNVLNLCAEVNNLLKGHDLFLHGGMDYYVFAAHQLEHPTAQEFGCDPDFSCWDFSIEKIQPSHMKSARTCGGHLHVGHPSIHQEIEGCVRNLDLLVGLYLAYKYPRSKRVNFYGKPGRFRPKEYGVEYRSPTNQWLLDRYSIQDIFTLIEFGLRNPGLWKGIVTTKKRADILQALLVEGTKADIRNYWSQYGIPKGRFVEAEKEPAPANPYKVWAERLFAEPEEAD